MAGFVKKSFKQRMADTGYLLKHSLMIIGVEQDLKTSILRMALFSAFLTTLIFFSFFTFFSGILIPLGVLVLLFAIFILIPYKFFFYVRQKADQSWLVYNAITGKDISFKEAHAHTRQHKKELRYVALVDLLVTYVTSQKKRGKGVGVILVNIFLAALREVWDLLQHYTIPVVVIEQKGIMAVVPQLKQLRKNVPATLVGVFGIDFVGGVVNFVLFPVYVLLFALSLGLGFLMTFITSSTIITIGSFSFSWVPPLLILYLAFLVGGILNKFVQAVKTIYFTIFYVSINRPAEITSDIRKDITNYLLMKK